MVRREVRDCDRCGAKGPLEIKPVIADHPRKRGDMDAMQSVFDLCPLCMGQIITKHLYGKTEEETRAFLGGKLAPK